MDIVVRNAAAIGKREGNRRSYGGSFQALLCPRRVRFAHDSLLEEAGFELVVPPLERTAVPNSSLVLAPAANVLIPRTTTSSSGYAEMISGRARRATCVIRSDGGNTRKGNFGGSASAPEPDCLPSRSDLFRQKEMFY